ncbi:hypothetical protein ACHAQH_003742 [Verticillium albo-atrum]
MAELENRGPEILAVAILFFVLSWVSVGLRIYTRGVLLRSLGLDDKLMVVLLVIFTGYLSSQITSVHYGNGQHDAALTDENRQKAMMVSYPSPCLATLWQDPVRPERRVLTRRQFWYICELIYIPSTCLLKVIVGFSLLRIATRRLHTRTLYVLMATTTLFGGTYFILVLLQCRPVATFWLLSPRARPQCFPDHIVISMTYTASVLNCAADWAFALLPALLVIPLRLPLRTRVGLAAILSLAALGSTATIVRAVYIPHLLSGDDFLQATADVALWSTVEPGLGIAAANLATLRPLWRALRRRALSSVRHPTPAPGKTPAGGTSEAASASASASTRMHRLRPDNAHSNSVISSHHADQDGEAGRTRRRPTNESITSRGINKTIDFSVSRSRATLEGDEDDETLFPAAPRIEIDRATVHEDGDEDEGGDTYEARHPDDESFAPPSFVDRFSADESDEVDRDLEGGGLAMPTLSSLSPVAPSLDWSSPRVSAISMGFCREKRSSRAARES